MKKTLKKISLIYAINAKWKARATKKRYRRLCEHYRVLVEARGISCSEETARQALRNRLVSRGIQPDSFRRGKIRILYVGSDQHQDTGGFLQALEKFGDVHLFESRDGSYGHYFSGHGKEAEIKREENGRRLIELATSIKAARFLPGLTGMRIIGTVTSRIVLCLVSSPTRS